MISLHLDEGDHLDGHLGRTAAFEDEVRVRIQKEVTGGAPKQGSSYKGSGSREGLPPVDLFLQIALATRAAELPVECIELARLSLQNRLVPLDSLPGQLRVHLLEYAHAQRLAEWPL